MAFYFVDETRLVERELAPGVTLRIVTGDQGQMSLVKMAAGARIPEHAHPEEQMGIVLEGMFDFVIEGVGRTVRAGDRYIIPGNARHAVVECPDGAVALDFFAPPREDYR